VGVFFLEPRRKAPPERDKAVDDAWKMAEKIMGRPLKKPQFPEKEREVQFFIPDHAGTPLFLVDAKGEILWEALPDDWKAAKEVELVKLLVSDFGVRQFIRFQGSGQTRKRDLLQPSTLL
jgi:hypothetical protein